ncbi:MAG: cation:proton antiporter [Patescibacteria group bacterium]|nr:cation:proton antiporter [Patescibacteria group bacterium]
MFKRKFLLPILGILFMIPALVSAAEHAEEGAAHGTSHAVIVLAFIALIVVLAKIAGAVAEKFNQVSVLGELLLGVLLGIPVLFGIQFFDAFKTDEFVLLFSEFAVILLLFQTGLESDLYKMGKVGIPAFLVAIIGVIAPFLLGTYIVGPWLMPGLDSTSYLFLGATLTATSVGITARVFKDLKMLQSRSSQIVLGAAVIDDVLGLLILAVVAAIVTAGHVSTGEVAIIATKALAFLVASIAIGRLIAPYVGTFLSKVHAGIGMKMAMALFFCLGYAYLSTLVGLAPIVGAFAAGLLLDTVHFKRFRSPRLVREIEEAMTECTDNNVKVCVTKAIDEHRHRHVEDLIEGISQWVVPVFFVITGLQVNLSVLANVNVLLVALGLTVAAIVGKLVAGFAAGKGADWKSVGVGMIPRGEVGLIFANVGKALGVVNDEAFAAIVIMIIITTIFTPVVLPMIAKMNEKKEKVQATA